MVRYNRMFAMVLTFVMVFTLAVVPARSVSAESASSGSLEINIDDGDTKYNGKLYLDMANEVFAAVGSMNYDGQTVMDAALYLGSAGLAVSATPFLDQAYGIDLQNLTRNLPTSVFAPDSGSKLALDQETYDMLMGGLDNALESALASQSAMSLDTELIEQGINTLMPHLENYMNTLLRNAQIAAGPKTLSLPTGNVKATASTVTVTGEVIAENMTTLLDSLAEDPEARAALVQIYDELVSSGAVTPSGSLEGVTGKEFFDTIFQNKDELCQELAKAMAESSLAITGSAAIDQQTEELVSIGLEITADGETIGLELVFANGTYYVDASEDGVHSRIVFCIQENTQSLFVATLAVTEDDVETARIAFNWNREAGTYELIVSEDSSTGILKGTITSDDTSTTITFDQIENQSLGNTYVKLSTDDPITFPSYKDVLTMTEEEILQVVQNVNSIVDQLSE